MDVFNGHHVIRVIIDSGATGNMIRHSTMKHLGSQIISNAQSVHQIISSAQSGRWPLQAAGDWRNTGFFLEIQVQHEVEPDSEYAIEPRSDAPSVSRVFICYSRLRCGPNEHCLTSTVPHTHNTTYNWTNFPCYTPEDIGVSVEYLNTSFLVKKPNAGNRLVAAFSDVGRYSKPQPSFLPDVDSHCVSSRNGDTS